MNTCFFRLTVVIPFISFWCQASITNSLIVISVISQSWMTNKVFVKPINQYWIYWIYQVCDPMIITIITPKTIHPIVSPIICINQKWRLWQWVLVNVPILGWFFWVSENIIFQGDRHHLSWWVWGRRTKLRILGIMSTPMIGTFTNHVRIFFWGWRVRDIFGNCCMMECNIDMMFLAFCFVDIYI